LRSASASSSCSSRKRLRCEDFKVGAKSSSILLLNVKEVGSGTIWSDSRWRV
jgi:hypothetical protein